MVDVLMVNRKIDDGWYTFQCKCGGFFSEYNTRKYYAHLKYRHRVNILKEAFPELNNNHKFIKNT